MSFIVCIHDFDKLLNNLYIVKFPQQIWLFYIGIYYAFCLMSGIDSGAIPLTHMPTILNYKLNSELINNQTNF